MDSAELGFKLSREFGDWDDSFDEPDVKNVYGEYGEFQLVGHGKVTNSYCGKFLRLKGCLRVDLHDRIMLNGENFKGKVYVQRVFNSCNKFSCPICFKYGACVREAGKIELRLKEASKRFGLVEHIVASVPVRDYGLSFEALRSRTIKALKVRGVVGGGLIFHAFRYNKRKSWYWSPHFHILGFILGGFHKCRRCPYVDDKGSRFNCEGCKGFYGVSKKHFKKDGYIVEVMGKRKTVFGTAWYQLNHASVKKNVKRFHVVTWFGVCSYRKLKVTAEYKKRVCPICQHDLVRLRYFGDKHYVRSWLFSSFDHDVERCSFEDYREDGCVVWFEDVKRGFR